MMAMLNLQLSTPQRWLDQVSSNLEELLIDHAHCEKKAAGVAMNLLFNYVENQALCQAMTEIVKEELEHFHLVRGLIEQRGIRFRRIPPSQYGEKMHRLIRKLEPGRAIDRLLVAALIEARSCERFGLLRDHLEDTELAQFFGNLFESEARHHSTYVQLARTYGSPEAVRERLQQLAQEESRLITEGETVLRVHS